MHQGFDVNERSTENDDNSNDEECNDRSCQLQAETR